MLQEFFEQRLRLTNSPALMKALLINGARSINNEYNYQIDSLISYQGWGLAQITNVLPAVLDSNRTKSSTIPGTKRARRSQQRRTVMYWKLPCLSLSSALGLIAAAPARAGIADTPLPTLLSGASTYHLYSVPGIIHSGGIGTFFSCTSTDTNTMQVGVELFSSAGGAAANDAVATSLSVGPGATVMFGTSAAIGIAINSSLGGGPMSKGSARILASSKKLACTVFLADIGNAPPTSMAQLTIIAKTKQKAAN